MEPSFLPPVPTGKGIEEEEEEVRRVRRLPAEGQLRRLRPLQERQEPPDLQGAPLRKTHREEDPEGGGKSVQRSLFSSLAFFCQSGFFYALPTYLSVYPPFKPRELATAASGNFNKPFTIKPETAVSPHERKIIFLLSGYVLRDRAPCACLHVPPFSGLL